MVPNQDESQAENHEGLKAPKLKAYSHMHGPPIKVDLTSIQYTPETAALFSHDHVSHK